jgi:hypothetical protein
VRVRVVLLVVQIAALWYGTRSMGMIGAVGIVVSMTLAERIIVVWKTAAILGMKLRDLRLFAEIPKIGLLAAACGVPTYLLRQTLLSQPPLVILIVCGAVFGTLLAGGFWKFGILEDDERQIVQRHARQAMLRFMPAAPRP